MRARTWAALAAAVALPLAARGQGRLTIAGVSGTSGRAVARQLGEALCREWPCVPKAAVYTGGRPDFGKARQQGVAGILYGSVTQKSGASRLWLALYTRSPEPERTWTLALTSAGTLPSASVERLAADLRAILRPSKPPPAARPAAPAAAAAVPLPPPPKPLAATPAPPPPPPLTVPPRELAPVVTGTVALSKPPPAAAPAPRAAAAPPPGTPGVIVELGIWISGRRLTYDGATPAGTVPLQEFQVDAVASPRGRLELYPAAWAGASGWLAGLGAFGGYSHSVGLDTTVAGATERHATTLQRVEAGLLWRTPPLGSMRLVLIPAVGWKQESLVVGGTPVPGLPDSHLSGFGGRLDAELPLSTRWGLLAGGGYVRWATAKDLVEGFFPGKSADGFEAEAGVAVGIGGGYSARLLMEWSSTSYTLEPDPTGTYRATGAKEAFLGGRAVVRGEF